MADKKDPAEQSDWPTSTPPEVNRLREELARASADPSFRFDWGKHKRQDDDANIAALREALRDSTFHFDGFTTMRSHQVVDEHATQENTRKAGRPPRSKKQVAEENALVDKVIALEAAGMPLKQAQERVAEKLSGKGTLTTKVRRLRVLRSERGKIGD